MRRRRKPHRTVAQTGGTFNFAGELLPNVSLKGTRLQAKVKVESIYAIFINGQGLIEVADTVIVRPDPEPAAV
jgi:hypothetical protein